MYCQSTLLGTVFGPSISTSRRIYRHFLMLFLSITKIAIGPGTRNNFEILWAFHIVTAAGPPQTAPSWIALRTIAEATVRTYGFGKTAAQFLWRLGTNSSFSYFVTLVSYWVKGRCSVSEWSRRECSVGSIWRLLQVLGPKDKFSFGHCEDRREW